MKKLQAERGERLGGMPPYGYDPYDKSVLGITAMTKMLGKSKFEELLGGLIVKPKGKPTLVPNSDKRAAINPAAEDFKEEK